MSCSDIFLGVIAILFPPVAVWIKSGLCSCDSLINILLCVLGYIPGLLHAWYIIAKYPEPDNDYEAIDAEGGRSNRVAYYYVSNEQQQHRGQGQGGRQQRAYGTQAQQPPRVPANKPARIAPAPRNQSNGNAPASNSQQSAGPSQSSAPLDDDAAPPSYNEVVRGDNKIQSQD